MIKAEGVESEMKGNIPDFKTFYANRKLKKSSVKAKAKIVPPIVLEESITSSAHYLALGPRRRQKSLKATDVLSDSEDNLCDFVEVVPSPAKSRGRGGKDVVPLLTAKSSNPPLLLKLPNPRSRVSIPADPSILESVQDPLSGLSARQRRGLDIDIRDLPLPPVGRKRDRDKAERLREEEGDLFHAGTPKKSKKEVEKRGKADALVLLLSSKKTEKNGRKALVASELADSDVVDLTASKATGTGRGSKEQMVGGVERKQPKSNKWAIPDPVLGVRGLSRRALPGASTSSISSSSSSSSSFTYQASYDKVLRDDPLTSAIFQTFSKAGMESYSGSDSSTAHSSEGFSAVFSLAGLDCIDDNKGKEAPHLCTVLHYIKYSTLPV
jgi:hypothetical protein